MVDFQFKRDLKYVMWGRTLRLNCLRAASSGVVFMILFLIMGGAQNTQPLPLPIPLMLLVVPIFFVFGYLVCWLPVGLICDFLNKAGVPFVGLFTFALSILIIPGDPLMYILHKFKPEFLGIENYPFIYFRYMIFIIDEERREKELGTITED